MSEDDDDFSDEEAERTVVVALKDVRGRKAVPQDRHLLVRLQGAQVGQVIALQGEEFRVGRARQVELWLGDGGVSRRHARFFLENGRYVLEDLDSANGTYVNAERITRCALKDGDVVQFGPSAVFRYSRADEEQYAMLQQLYDASVTDALTGAYNREHFDARLEAELSFARRHGTELSLLLMDIDHFKKVNDTYGHQAGDTVLAQLSATVAAKLRAEDVFARYGGEEFAIILRGIDLADASHVGERFRALVRGLNVEHGGRILTISVSIGVASLVCCGEDQTAEALIRIADRRLYKAKRGGRNQVVGAG